MNERLFYFVLTMIFLGTGFLLLTQDPEHRIVSSEDGAVHVVGQISSDLDLKIEMVQGVGRPGDEDMFTAVVSPIYTLVADESVLSIPAELRMRVEGAGENLKIGMYDEVFGMWRIFPTELVDRKFVTRLSRFEGRFAVLAPEDVVHPNFEVEIERLLDAAPAGSVGYEIEVGYARVPGDFVMLEGEHLSGGCAGQLQSGIATQMTSIADIFADTLEYQVVAIWQIGEGCGGRASIEEGIGGNNF